MCTVYSMGIVLSEQYIKAIHYADAVSPALVK